MKHNTFEELRSLAKVTKVYRPSPWEVRRERLLRMAALVEATERPVRLFHQLEFMSDGDRHFLRSPDSPLSVAFADPVLREQGLDGEDYRAAVEFFDLSPNEAHQILCDCHYAGHKPTQQMIASRIRSIAGRKGLAERLASLKQRVAAWL